MDAERIERALKDASDTRRVVIGAGALAEVDTTFEHCFGNHQAVVVADENTFAAAGRVVDERLRASGREVAPPIVFPGTPTLYADFDNVLALETQLRDLNATPVVVGSGTLNDLTKLASHRVGHQYMCVGTAASMDGYTSFGASITKDGFKQTMSCPAPRAVLADLDVLVHAPPAMHATGYGDLLGKVTAGADWILADALKTEPIDPRAWGLVQDSLRSWIGRPAEVSQSDPSAIEHLFEGLTLTGIAMQISGSSRPASGSEHRFSHLWEMQALGHGHPAVAHGFKVGVGSLAAAALYERVLLRDFAQLDIDGLCRAWPSREQVEQTVRAGHDIPPLAENAVEETLAKHLTPDELRERLLVIQQLWPTLRERLRDQLMSADELRSMLKAAGCPTEPTEIGLTLPQVRESYWLARTIRSRYTVLDLIYETGILEECVAELFAPDGYWGKV